MIFGDCPYCNQPIVNYMPEITPQFGKNICSECGEQYWMYYSRINPIAYNREGFEEKFTVDESTKSIKKTENYQKECDDADKFRNSDIGKFFTKKVQEDMLNLTLYGTTDLNVIKKGLEEGFFIKLPELTEEEKSKFSNVFQEKNDT